MDITVAIGTWETPPTYNGPANYIQELVERLSRKIRVVLLVPNFSTIKSHRGLEVTKIGSVNVPVLRVCSFVMRASLLSNKLNVDLIHDNGVLGYSNFSPFIETWHHSQIYDRKNISFIKYYSTIYREMITMKGIRKADRIIAVSSLSKKQLINLCPMKSSVVNIIQNGVDVDFFKPKIFKDTENESRWKGKIKLLYVGGLFERKNLNSLIQALKIVLKKKSNLHLIIIGTGPEKSNLIRLVAHLNLNQNVTFFEKVSRSSLLLFFNLADFVIQPSYNEGFGLTILEGLACEKPIIMTPTGISDVIKNNNLGVVTENFTPSSLASAIQFATDEPRFGNLRRFVVENFNWSKSIEKHIKLYEDVLNNQ